MTGKHGMVCIYCARPLLVCDTDLCAYRKQLRRRGRKTGAMRGPMLAYGPFPASPRVAYAIRSLSHVILTGMEHR